MHLQGMYMQPAFRAEMWGLSFCKSTYCKKADWARWFFIEPMGEQKVEQEWQ